MDAEAPGNFDAMYKALTDPEEREKRRRITERAKRKEEKMADTGAYVV